MAMFIDDDLPLPSVQGQWLAALGQDAVPEGGQDVAGAPVNQNGQTFDSFLETEKLREM